MVVLLRPGAFWQGEYQDAEIGEKRYLAHRRIVKRIASHAEQDHE
ncbi:hypothetical protein LG58_4863 [Kosakonia radicincitans YD4]|nr:hypothetical protein LG58_4863 [Kosakonia radicincitans YD4]